MDEDAALLSKSLAQPSVPGHGREGAQGVVGRGVDGALREPPADRVEIKTDAQRVRFGGGCLAAMAW